MGKEFILSESERRRIRNLYMLVEEESTYTFDEPKDLTAMFSGDKTTSDTAEKFFREIKNDLIDHMDKTTNSNYTIVIDYSDKGKTGLGEDRAKFIENTINKVFSKETNSGVLKVEMKKSTEDTDKISITLKGSENQFDCGKIISVSADAPSAKDFLYVHTETFGGREGISGIKVDGQKIPDRPAIKYTESGDYEYYPYFVTGYKADEPEYMLYQLCLTSIFRKNNDSVAFSGLKMVERRTIPFNIVKSITKDRYKQAIDLVFSDKSLVDKVNPKLVEHLKNFVNQYPKEGKLGDNEAMNFNNLLPPQLIPMENKDAALEIKENKPFQICVFSPLGRVQCEIVPICK
jgi:hypothetical protein